MPKLLLLEFATTLSLCFSTCHPSLATTELQPCAVRLEYDMILAKLLSEGVELKDIIDPEALPETNVFQLTTVPLNQTPWLVVAAQILDLGLSIRFGLFQLPDATPVYSSLRLGKRSSDVLISFAVLKKPNFQIELERVLSEELAHYLEMMPFRTDPKPATAAPLIEIIDSQAIELPQSYRSNTLRLDETRHNSRDPDQPHTKIAMAKLAFIRLRAAVDGLKSEINTDWSHPVGLFRRFLGRPAYGSHAVLAEFAITSPAQSTFLIRVPFVPEYGISEQGGVFFDKDIIFDTLHAGIEYVEAVL